MTVESSAPLETALQPRPAGLLAHPRLRRIGRRLGGVAIALAVLGCAVLVAVWPTLTLLALGSLLIAGLAWFAPPFALAGAVLLYGLEGVIKVGLARELPRYGLSPDAVGAASIDLALLVAVLGLVRHDRGRTLRVTWSNAGRWARIGVALLAAWLVLSLGQMALTDDLGNALAGFRLTQAYLLAVLAGVMLLATRRPEQVLTALVAVLVVIAAYAAIRGVAGPSDSERVAALSRSTTPLVPIDNGVIFRNTGSFSSAIGLASFLVPAGVFLLALGLSVVRLRLAAWIGVALALVALVGSHVRMAVIATALGAICTAALLAFTSGLARRTKIALGVATVPLLVAAVMVAGLAATTVSGGSPQVAQRSAGLVNPLSDPSVEGRLERWGEALDVVKTNPLGTGVGTVGAATVDEDGTARFADNSYVKILEEQGPLGAVAFLLGICLILVAVAAGLARRAGSQRAVGIAALSACASFLVLAFTSEAIEQPGKVLAWLTLGIALWAAFGAAPGGASGRAVVEEKADTRGKLRELAGLLPGWARSRYALLLVLPLIVVPVGVNMLRASHFETALEVLPTQPPGNAGVTSAQGSSVPDLIDNPGFQMGADGWKEYSPFTLRRATKASHSGAASLASVRDGPASSAGRAASTPVVLPGPGRYRVQAWVRLPDGYRGGSPRIALEDLADGTQVAARGGDPRMLERWQPIWSDYVVGSDVEALIVLRTDSPLPVRGQVVHWDDVSVMSWNAPRTSAGSQVNLVSNPGFEYDRSAWGDPPVFKARRSTALARNGSASLRSSSDQRSPRDTNAGYTHIVFPRAGTYRARVWAYVPRRAPAVAPAVFLEGFSASTQLAQRVGDPDLRDTWQLVTVDYAISSQDLQGSLVLRALSVPGAPGSADDARRVVNWDDADVFAMRSELPRDSLPFAASVRSALEEPQLRFEVSLMAPDDSLYDPTRATVVRSSRPGTLSYIVKVASDVPREARSLSGPLRSALIRAARRNALRRAQADWQSLVSRLARDLSPGQAAVLQRRANVLQRVIGAQAFDAVALPTPARPASPETRRFQQKVSRERQRVIARLGSGLPPRQRALVQQRVDDLQRMVGAQTPEFVVLPFGPAPEPTRPVDRLIDKLPGPFAPRIAGGWAGAAGGICALVLFGMLVTGTALRRRVAARTL